MSGAIAVVIAAIGSLAGLSAMIRVRAQNRVDDANASVTEATAADKWEKLYSALQDRVQSLEKEREEMRAAAAELRESASNAEASAADARLEAQRARTEKAQAETQKAAAQTRVAELEAELARSIAAAREERHKLRNEFETWMRSHEAERVTERAAYEKRIQLLEDRVETLSAQLGVVERRHRTDRRNGDDVVS